MDEQQINAALDKLGPAPTPRNVLPDSLASRLGRLAVGEHIPVSKLLDMRKPEDVTESKANLRGSVSSSIRIARRRIKGGEFSVGIDAHMISNAYYVIAIITRIK
jgi:hypothetical protein